RGGEGPLGPESERVRRGPSAAGGLRTAPTSTARIRSRAAPAGSDWNHVVAPKGATSRARRSPLRALDRANACSERAAKPSFGWLVRRRFGMSVDEVQPLLEACLDALDLSVQQCKAGVEEASERPAYGATQRPSARLRGCVRTRSGAAQGHLRRCLP